MRFTPGGAVDVALPAACVAPHGRDARAPHARISCARCVCLQARGAVSETSAWSMVEALASTRSAYALALLLTRALPRREQGGSLWWAVHGSPLCSKSHCARGPCFSTKKNSTLPQAPFGRILIFFSDFCSVEKRVTRSREWHQSRGVNRTSKIHQNPPYAAPKICTVHDRLCL